MTTSRNGDTPAQLTSEGRAARLLSRAIFAALLALLAVASIPYGAVEPAWEAVIEAALFLLGALWMIHGYAAGVWLVPAHRVALPLLLLAAWALTQTLPLLPNGAISVSPYDTRLVVLKLAAYTLALVLLLLRYTQSPRRLRALVITVVAIGVASAPFGIARQVGQRGEVGFLLPLLPPATGYGQFINRNHFAYLMELPLGLCLGIVAARGVSRDRLLVVLAPALPLAAALVFSNSRGGVFSMVIQILLAGFVALTFSGRAEQVDDAGGRGSVGRRASSLAAKLALGAALVIATVFGVLWLGGEPLASRMEQMHSELPGGAGEQQADSGGGSRSEIWRATWGIIEERPLAGVGFGAYSTAVTRHHVGSGSSWIEKGHNDYLELLASGGIVGAALAAWFVLRLIKGARRGMTAGRGDAFGRAARTGALIGLAGVAAHSAVDFELQITAVALLAIALAAVAAAEPSAGRSA